MTETLPQRFLLDATPAEVAALLPAIGRAMVGISGGGTTHERIGVIEAAPCTAATLRIEGALHDAELALSRVVRVIGDRSSTMRGKSYPRFEFKDAADVTLLSVIAMDGPEQYDVAVREHVGAELETLPRRDLPPTEQPPEADAGNAALEALRDSGGQVEIRFGEAGASQAWRGQVEEVKGVMGYANIIRPDFHLHLRGGSVAAFRREAAGLVALDAAGAATGLVLRPLDATAEAALARFG
ncbi:hypothetical protein [Falsiroseomonas sp.]|uniref:hypothetical protein n=1 Tax=Falsiroseomonas sp. TaxID=2870721 RepID=UPI0027157381|nr:hypothetical protein [Falsiroseomonas sp.]MDO9501807.1 hypothetical protein [Falsiroseomonas sp.]